ncbi:MAG: alanyl-tRNA editing protein [Lachnospiraceae bacterium]
MKKLFYEDTHIVDFKATVISCDYEESKKAYKILTDATAFFPEEGGQSADRGTLGNQDVLDVQLDGDFICHYVKNPIKPGTVTDGHVDWEGRFDFMQQHSGEHIISGLIHSRFGYSNVGFHLSVNEVTLDVNGPLSAEELKEIETEANRVVYKNLPVYISYPDKAELKDMTYRSKIAIDGQVRLVTIPGVDVCACCAPHVSYTGEIGIIKITQAQSYKGGMRLHILCGGRALSDYSIKQSNVEAIAVALSAKQEQVTDAFFRLKDENLKLKESLNSLQAKYLMQCTALLPSPESTKNALLFTELSDNIAIRNAVNTLTEQYSGYSAVFFGEKGNYRFIAGSKSADCSLLAQELRNKLGAKCGGSSLMIQGSISADKSEITELFSLL